MKFNTEMQVRVRAVDSACYNLSGESGEEWTPWKKNLILDQTLNSLCNKSGGAGSTNGANSFVYCQVGTSAAANSVPSGAITFTQSGNTITASSTFFTSGMVGALIKYGIGTAGAEQYIVSQTGTACVVSGAGMTVGTPTVATVWLVQQTALVSPLLTTNTYQTSGTSNQTVQTANVITHQRTFNFAVQASSYNANEIGWYSAAGTTFSFGRLVLASTIVVAPTQFLQVQLQLVITFAPGTPTAVGNVGTGINTAGNLMYEYFAGNSVQANGASVGATGLNDAAAAVFLSVRISSTYSQNSATAASASPSWAGNLITNAISASWVYSAGTVGIATMSFLTQTYSTTGQTCYAFGIVNSVAGTTPQLDVKFTTPFVLPTGTFHPQTVWQMQYSRTLTN